MLEIRDLYKSFDGHTVLNGVNLQIEKGSIFGLVGINGAGKSTLLRCISAVYQPEGGQVLLDGVNTYATPEIRKDIVFVSDDMYFEKNATIRSTASFYRSFYDLDDVLYYRYLKMFHLDENTQISSFSKGMKRQTSLLFALSIRPKLLLLDECFDGLDPLVRLTFKKALVDMLEDQKATVIISSHNLKELEDICDTFGILDNGVISSYGDLLESKENITKYQLAFNEDKDKSDFAGLDIINFRKEGMVYTLVIKGDREKVTEELRKKEPLLLNELPVNFEELFIYEVESRGLLDE